MHSLVHSALGTIPRALVSSLLVVLLAMTTSCNDVVVVPNKPPTAYDADKFDADPLATLWFDCASLSARSTKGFTEPVSARAYAYLGICLYESLKPGLPLNYKSLAGQLRDLPTLPQPDTAGKRYHWTIVANAAMAHMMRSLFSHASASVLAHIDTLEAQCYRERADRTHDEETSQRSVAFGKKVADAVIEYSKGDGGQDADLNNYSTAYNSADSSSWQSPIPGSNPLLASWSTNRPLLLNSNEINTELDPGPYPVFSTAKSSDFFREAVDVRSKVNSRLPDDQIMVSYWGNEADCAQTVSTHMIDIATQLLRSGAFSLSQSAELYARLGIALNDATIACWTAKYKYPLMRPVTYIKLYVDKAWMNNAEARRVQTPNSPEYVSSSATLVNACVPVLQSVFGKAYLFTDRSQSPTVQTERDYYTFDQITNEVVSTQLMSGTQYRFSITAGEKLGSAIAAKADQRLIFKILQ